ncbi:uncharacterized protein [Penaeus vannamei]|uniref:uncharacterized protein n=1 Tax=Penaeus vannamei TaxID=6689 RepID=UPI000F68FCA4|nr:uncharacterized protein LOC113811932 [Penaeus vannamei]
MKKANQNPDLARTFPTSDAQGHRRTLVRNGRRLPYQERIRLRKIAQRRRRKRVEEVKATIRKAPWNMMFADDVVLCAREKRQLEEDLEQWRYALERRGMKISRSKTEYMCLNGISTGSVEMLQRQLPETMAFKYLGNTRDRWRSRGRSKPKDTMWMEQLEEDVWYPL